MSRLAKTASMARTWEQWAPARLASIDKQIAAAKGPVRDDRQFSLAVWNATVERLFIRLAQHDDIKRGAGPVRFWLALSSFRNTREHEPNEKAECRVRTSVRDFQTGRIEPGPLADRCGLHPSTIDHYLPWLRDDDDLETGKARKDSLKILTVAQSRGDRQGASSYDWSLDFPSIVMSMAKPNRGSKRPIEWPFRLSSRVVVAAFLVKKMKRTEGRVSLRRRDLAATGLDVDAAHKALNWLLAEGFFIKVGDGVAALPEMVTAGVYGKVEGRFWDRKSNRPEGQSAEAKTRSARPVRTVRKASQNGLEGQTGRGLEGRSGGPSGRPDGEQHEVALNLLEEFKRLEGENFDDDITAVTHQLSKSELQEPDESSGFQPSPASGQLSSSLLVDEESAEARDAQQVDDDEDRLWLSAGNVDEAEFLRALRAAQRRVCATVAVNLCDDIRRRECSPPDVSDLEAVSGFMRLMSDGILVDPEPSDDVLEVVTVAASRHDPAIIFGIMAQSLRLRHDHGDGDSTWPEIANALTYVIARAKDEDLVVVPRPTSAFVDELAQSRADDAEVDVTSNPEAEHAQPIV